MMNMAVEVGCPGTKRVSEKIMSIVFGKESKG